MSAEVFGLTQQILMLISAYINTGVCGKLRIFGKTATTTLPHCHQSIVTQVVSCDDSR